MQSDLHVCGAAGGERLEADRSVRGAIASVQVSSDEACGKDRSGDRGDFLVNESNNSHHGHSPCRAPGSLTRRRQLSQQFVQSRHVYTG